MKRSMLPRFAPLWTIVIVLLISGCSSGAVVFAPLPADGADTPRPYTHPGGIFTVAVPPTWTTYTQQTPSLASASFSPPNAPEPALTIGLIRLEAPITPETLAELVERYQTQVRSDVGDYAEVSRDVLADGSWRMGGARLLPGGLRQPINTFMAAANDHVIVIESIIPEATLDGERLRRALQTALNTVQVSDPEALRPTDLTTLNFLKPTALAILHVRGWTAPDGAFFLTGEVANYGATAAVDLPIEAALIDQAGAVVAGAVDVALGAGIPPGGFAPFSLRFASQPPTASSYALTVGQGWTPTTDTVHSADVLIWTDSFRYDEFGRLVIEGEVTNAGALPLREVIASTTLFDAAGGVIGAGWVAVTPALAPDAAVPFSLLLPQIGGSPANYLVTITALPASPEP